MTIKQTTAAFGCEGGTFEKASEGSGVLEAEGVNCKAGQYDFRLDKEGNVTSITRDDHRKCNASAPTFLR